MKTEMERPMANLAHWIAGNRPPQRRWATADVDFVRDARRTMSAAEMAGELGEPVERVRGLVRRIKNRAAVAKADGASAAQCGDGVQSVQNGVASDLCLKEASVQVPGPAGASRACFEPPADLRAFVHHNSVSQVAQALKISRGTAYRLRDGYWPGDARNLLAAWERYAGRDALRAGAGWFLRRVRGGAVRHGAKQWSCAQLAGREGELVALARAADGGLVAQTLDLPPERLLLREVA